jgi:epoxyqueuosine reductase
MNIKSQIVEFCNGIGITSIGFSDIEFNEDFYKSIKQRRENGHLSGFEESDENIRINTRALLKEVRTLISIIVPYRTIEVNKKKPYFSRVSLGLDYHNIVMKKLELISDFLYYNFNAKCKCYCDIGPLSDREIAKKCGLGFYGKNTSLITKQYGSFVFLGEILTDIYIDRDFEIIEDCGECELCIKACPTGALERPYYLNAKKCLAYVGQKKTQLSEDEINNLGNRIYGCDTCQDVCPHNNVKEISAISEFYPEEWNYKINEEYILNMSNKDFKEKFGKTSSGWRGKRILKRNLIIAMGNSKNKDYLEILKKIRDEGLDYYVNLAIMKLESEGNEKG